MNQPRLLVRAEASVELGAGHVMRCMALAKEWNLMGGESVFARHESLPAIDERLRGEGFALESVEGAAGSSIDAERTVTLAGELGAAWVVADGYCFTAQWQEAVKRAGLRLLLWDDYGHAERYSADIVLNQNPSAEPTPYTARQTETELLLGARYTVLRREFVSTAESLEDGRRHDPSTPRVLVTLGGTDPPNVTSRIVAALGHLDNVDAVVVAGSGNPHVEMLRQQISTMSGRVQLRQGVTDMADLMKQADLAIAAGGTTALELAACGVPSLLVVLAENQRLPARHLVDAGVAALLDDDILASSVACAAAIEDLAGDCDRRRRMGGAGRKMFDGLGGRRVVTKMRAVSMREKLRLVDEHDSRMLWDWANSPEVRSVSFSSEPIPRDRHEAWFEARLNDPECVFFVAEGENGKPLGQVRFEIEAGAALISVCLAPDCRGLGLGPVVISAGVDRLFSARPDVSRIDAWIKPGNTASLRAFEIADFTDRGEGTFSGHVAQHFVMRSNQQPEQS